LSVKGSGQEWTVICNGALGELTAAAASLGARVVDQGVPSLDEIFVARVGAKSLKTQPPTRPS
jgi:ABC-2 type transport system ATP-binding protein